MVLRGCSVSAIFAAAGEAAVGVVVVVPVGVAVWPPLLLLLPLLMIRPTMLAL